ncbi:MAG TPA: hypothetical protein VII93_05485, partial [Anaerolineales bacterium]
RSIIFDKLAKIEKLEVTQQMLQASFEQTWGEYQGDSTFQKAMRGKSKPPKQLMNAVAMESANRAYVQQTLNRLKEIATGQAPELPIAEDSIDSATSKPMKKSVKKTSSKSSIKEAKTVNKKVAGTNETTKKNAGKTAKKQEE